MAPRRRALLVHQQAAGTTTLAVLGCLCAIMMPVTALSADRGSEGTNRGREVIIQRMRDRILQHYEYRFHCVRSAYGCICAYGAAYGVRHCAYRLHIPKMQTADPCPGNQFFSTYHLDLVKPLADVCIYAHTRMQCACRCHMQRARAGRLAGHCELALPITCRAKIIASGATTIANLRLRGNL